MLVVVENRDLHALPQPRLDDEALGRLDVLQVDAAEGRLQARDDLNQLVGIGFVDFDIEHVDAGELFEQAAFALHHGLAGERADVAEPQHRRAVGDHGDEVGARGQVGGLDRVVLDGHAGRRNPRRIGQRQIALRGHVLGGQDRDFSRSREAMIIQRRSGQGVVGPGFGVRLAGRPEVGFLAHGRLLKMRALFSSAFFWAGPGERAVPVWTCDA
jgi:hypothetical protein